MPEFSSSIPLPTVPSNLSVPQFLFDCPTSALRTSVRFQATRSLVDDKSGRGISLEELRQRISGLGCALHRKYNITQNEVVLILSPNHIDYPVVVWAVHRLGAIITGANPSSTVSELVYQIEMTRASILISHPSTIETALQVARLAGIPSDRVILLEPSPKSNSPNVPDLVADGIDAGVPLVEKPMVHGEGNAKVAFLCMSSGTTGKPKVVMLSHSSVIAHLLQLRTHYQHNEPAVGGVDRRYIPGDASLGVLPFFHAAGLAHLHFCILTRVSLVVASSRDLTTMLDNIVRYNISHLLIVPATAVTFCKHPIVENFDLSKVKSVIVGAAPMTKEINTQLFKVFKNAEIGGVYGLTEATAILSMLSLNRHSSAGSAGQLVPGVKARVLREDGSLAGFNEPGELVVKTNAVTMGYLHNESATKDAFLDGWLRTGDQVIVDKNNEIWVTDRIKELIKVRGFQVAPAELEGAILDHPDVSDVCVVGIPDEYHGELPFAFVVLTSCAAKRVHCSPSLAEGMRLSIEKLVADNKINYKHLAGVEIVDSIPRNTNGKLLRRVVRDMAKEFRKTLKAKL